MENKNVEQTKKMLDMVFALTAIMATSFKDGVQATDFAVIMAKINSDEALKSALMNFYNEVDQVKLEMADLKMSEGIELALFAIPKAMNLVKAIQG